MFLQRWFLEAWTKSQAASPSFTEGEFVAVELWRCKKKFSLSGAISAIDINAAIFVDVPDGGKE